MAVACLLFSLASRSALAHPHILIEVQPVLRFENGLIVGLDMSWAFDPLYSNSLLLDFDANRDGALSAKEIETLAAEAFEPAREQSYFVHATVDTKPITWSKASGFTATIDKGVVTYRFALSLPQPVEPQRHAVEISFYEPTYFIEVTLPGRSSVSLRGAGADRCDHVVTKDLRTPLLGGVVFPNKMELKCQ